MYRLDDANFKKSIVNYAIKTVLKNALPKRKENIISWAESHIDLSYDRTSAAKGKIKLLPYQIEPLQASDTPEVKEITLMLPQRTGKSLIWRTALQKHIWDSGTSSLIVFPSLDLAQKICDDTLLPMIKTIPECAEDLAKKGNRKQDVWRLPSLQSGVIIKGGGTQVIGLTCNLCVFDETDFTDLKNSDAESENMSQLKAIRLRMQTYPERLLIACSSPTSYGGVIYQNWLKGSQGVFNLVCPKCGSYSPSNKLSYFHDSGRYRGLQWEKDYSGNIINESIRWICPVCGAEYTESDSEKLRAGKYIHGRENQSHKSYTMGALASPIFSWLEIAQSQEEATDADGKKFLQNSILGLPYKHVKESEETIEDALKSHCIIYPETLELSCVVIGVDQQASELAGKKYWVYTVRGWAENGDSYLLKSGTVFEVDDLRKVLTTKYNGLYPIISIIDQGGFTNVDDTDTLVASISNCVYYKGADSKFLKGKLWERSKTQSKLFWGNRLAYQIKILELLYNPPRKDGYRFYMPDTPETEYLKQMASVRPNKRLKAENQDNFANWCVPNSDYRKDFWDAERMGLVGLDIACALIPANKWKLGHIPRFKALEKINELARQKRLTK